MAPLKAPLGPLIPQVNRHEPGTRSRWLSLHPRVHLFKVLWYIFKLKLSVLHTLTRIELCG